MTDKGRPALGPTRTRDAVLDAEEDVPVSSRRAPAAAKLGIVERRVLARVNGKRTVGEISRQLGLSVPEIAAVLVRLREVGVLDDRSPGVPQEIDLDLELDDGPGDE
jgi:hypothetical protein